MTKSVIGAQMYTLRDHPKTPPEIAKTCARVKKMDETGLVLEFLVGGMKFGRLEHTFTAVEGGTRYHSTLTLGSDHALLKHFNGLARRIAMPVESAAPGAAQSVRQRHSPTISPPAARTQT